MRPEQVIGMASYRKTNKLRSSNEPQRWNQGQVSMPIETAVLYQGLLGSPPSGCSPQTCRADCRCARGETELPAREAISNFSLMMNDVLHLLPSTQKSVVPLTMRFVTIDECKGP